MMIKNVRFFESVILKSIRANIAADGRAKIA